MTYQQAYGMADTLVRRDGIPRYIVTDNGQEHGSDNYEAVKREQLTGRKPIVRMDRNGAAAQITLEHGWGA